MDSLLNFGATVIVAIIGLVGIVIQTKSKEKQDSISKKIDTLSIESKNGDRILSSKLDDSKMQILKVWLTNELRISNNIQAGNPLSLILEIIEFFVSLIAMLIGLFI